MTYKLVSVKSMVHDNIPAWADPLHPAGHTCLSLHISSEFRRGAEVQRKEERTRDVLAVVGPASPSISAFW